MTNKTNQVELNIVKTVFPYWLGLVAVFSIGFFMAYGWQGTYSVVLGSIFSLLGLRQLSEDQYAILVQRKRKKVFISFLFRLAIYSIPIITSLKFPNYFKFWIILICLFKSQVIFIMHELILNYKNYKKRMANDG